jgi:hypothetical protein
MTSVVIDVQDSTGRVTTVQASEEMRVSQVAQLAQVSLGLAYKDHLGRTLRYALFHQSEGRFLHPDLALHGVNLSGRWRILPRAFSELFELELLSEPNPGMLFPLPPKELSIGREFGNNIVIRHRVVSRQHGLFTWEDGFHLYMDLGSANGSWINNYPVTKPTPIANGDILNLGQSVTLVYHERHILSDPASHEADQAITTIETNPGRTGLVKLPKGEVFLSVAPSQDELAQVLVEALAQAGIKPWTSTDDMASALQRSDAMIVILSREAVESEALREQWQAFHTYRKPFLPILFEPCRVPVLLQDVPQMLEYHFHDADLVGDVLDALRHLMT